LETLIVVVIAGILLAMTMRLGGTYLSTVKYRYEKEEFIGMMDKMIATVRTSNYWGNTTYEYIELQLAT